MAKQLLILLIYIVNLMLIFRKYELLEIASCSEESLLIWNNSVSEEIDYGSCYLSLFSENYLLSGNENGTIKVWDLANFSSYKPVMEHGEKINSVQQIDNETFAVGSEKTFSFWNITNYTLTFKLNHSDKMVYFKTLFESSMLVCLFRIDKLSQLSGKSVLSWDKSTIRILNTENMDQIGFENNSIEEDGRVNCIETFEKTLIVYCLKNYVKFYNLSNNSYWKEKKLDGYLSSIKYINSSLFAVAYFNGKVGLMYRNWKIEILKELSFTIDGINLENSEYLIGFSRKKIIHVWNLEDNESIARFNHKSNVDKFLFLKNNSNFSDQSNNPEDFELETLNLKNLSLDKIDIVLSSGIDVTDCLTMCSGRGKCVLSKPKKFSCLCNPGFIGSICQIDLNPCSSNPCLNNGICNEYFSNNSTRVYKCQCQRFYFGTNCQFEIDVCENETCSSNGVCESVNFIPKCKCFALYIGDKCELEKQEKKTVDRVTKTSKIIAIIFLLSFIIVILIIDFSSIFLKKKRKMMKKETKRPIKFIYYS